MCTSAVSLRPCHLNGYQAHHRLGQGRQLTLVLATALFVLRLPDVWHPVVVHWPAKDRLRVLRQLGSAVDGTAGDRGDPYLLLRGVQRILDALSVLVTCATQPPPSDLLFKVRVPT